MWLILTGRRIAKNMTHIFQCFLATHICEHMWKRTHLTREPTLCYLWIRAMQSEQGDGWFPWVLLAFLFFILFLGSRKRDPNQYLEKHCGGDGLAHPPSSQLPIIHLPTCLHIPHLLSCLASAQFQKFAQSL